MYFYKVLLLFLHILCIFFFFSHTVNLLINIPPDFYEELLTPMVEEDKGTDSKDLEYDGKNMDAINVILEFLDHRLRTVGVNLNILVFKRLKL